MHVMYGYVEIYDITAATAKAFEMITRSHQKLVTISRNKFVN